MNSRIHEEIKLLKEIANFHRRLDKKKESDYPCYMFTGAAPKVNKNGVLSVFEGCRVYPTIHERNLTNYHTITAVIIPSKEHLDTFFKPYLDIGYTLRHYEWPATRLGSVPIDYVK